MKELSPCKKCGSKKVSLIGCGEYGYWCECLDCSTQTPVKWNIKVVIALWETGKEIEVGRKV